MDVRSNPLRVTLVMALMLVISACTESYDLSLTYTSEGVPRGVLSIDNIDGSVRLQRGAVGSRVQGTLRIRASGFDKEAQAKQAAEGVRILETVSAGALSLAVAIPAEHRNKTFSVTLDLTVPEGTEVSVTTDNGRISVNGLPVGVLDTTSGDVDLQFTSAVGTTTSTIKTNDGLVTVDSHDGPLDASTSNADLRLFSINGSTRATTTNGFIEARIFPPEGGDIFLATTNNGIDLSLSSSFGAQLLAVTTEPGAIGIAANLRFTPRRTFPGQLEGVIGDGRGRIDVRTTVGDVFIGR